MESRAAEQIPVLHDDSDLREMVDEQCGSRLEGWFGRECGASQ